MTGGSILAPGEKVQNADTAQQEQQKSKLASAYYQLKLGQASAASVKALMSSYSAKYGAAVSASSSSASGALPIESAAAARTSYALAVTAVGQITNYYCGPAAAYVSLKYTKHLVGSYKANHVGLSQKNLARSAYLATDANKATRFASDRMRIGVNRWRGGSDTGWYSTVTKPSLATYKHHLAFDIDSGVPMFVSTVEAKKGPRYNQHPESRVIGHWLTAYAYRERGGSASFTDSAYILPGFEKSLAKFAYTSPGFVSTFVQGITW